MARHENGTYNNTRLNLDGHEYINCTLNNCELVFRGEQFTTLEGCTFNGCQWVLSGPAKNTVEFLRAVYQAGDWGKQIVEDTFDSIRSPATK